MNRSEKIAYLKSLKELVLVYISEENKILEKPKVKVLTKKFNGQDIKVS